MSYVFVLASFNYYGPAAGARVVGAGLAIVIVVAITFSRSPLVSLFGGALYASWSADDATAKAALIVLAIIGVLNAAISAAYYLRVVGVMYFRPTVAAPAAQGPLSALGAGIACALLVLVVGVLPGWLFTQATGAARAAVTTTNSYHAQDMQRAASPRPTDQASSIRHRASLSRKK